MRPRHLGPFREKDFSDQLSRLEDELRGRLAAFGDGSTGWAGPDRLIWEGWVDGGVKPDDAHGLVFRADFYVGERDTYGIGFSDNVVFRKQYYIQVFPGNPPQTFIHTGEHCLSGASALSLDQLQIRARPGPGSEIQVAQVVSGSRPGWSFEIGGTGFAADCWSESTPTGQGSCDGLRAETVPCGYPRTRH